MKSNISAIFQNKFVIQKFMLAALIFSIISVTLAILFPAHVSAQAADSPLKNPPIRNIQWPAYEGVAAESVWITKDTSQVFRFDRPVTRTAISNSNVCDITPIGDRDVLINAKEAGIANLIVWDNHNNIATYRFESTLDLEKLNKMLYSIDSGAELVNVPFNDSVAVYGTTETSLKLKQIDQAVTAFDKQALSFVKLKDPKQILLEVRFAEINRKNNKDFKFDTEAITQYVALRDLTGQTGVSTLDSDSSFRPRGSPVTYEQIGLPTEEQINLFASYVDSENLISGFLEWLEQRNVLKIIARPNLVAKDGEEANFVVGGEFPIAISTNNNINIEFKEFGTKLKFTPEALEDDMIRLKVETEVSELDFSTTVTLSGFTIPSIIKRTHQTVSELRDDQSLVIGGLLTQKINKIKKRIPIFGRIPFLGNLLFSSDEFARTDVELLVAITPHIVKPFELSQKKTFYDAKTVSQATRAYSAAYPDAHGDAIRKLLIQNEEILTLDKEEDASTTETSLELPAEKEESMVDSSAAQNVVPPVAPTV